MYICICKYTLFLFNGKINPMKKEKIRFAIFGNEYETNFANGTYAPVETLKKELKLMWLGTGKDDFLIQSSLGLDEYLTRNGLDHTFYNPEGGHTWMNCRDYLELTVKELFK